MLTTLCLLAAIQTGNAPLTESSLASWTEYLQPSQGEERWREIPWVGTLWEGVNAAQAEKKPLLLWAMNGHPLGCT